MEVDETAPTPGQETEKILINMLKKCELEAKTNSLQIPLKDFEDRVSYYTGIPKLTLQQIQNENTSRIYPKISSVDFNFHLVILKCLCSFYEHKKIPTFTLLFKKVNEFLAKLSCEPVQDPEQFRRDLIALGIDYQTISNDTKLLMEDPNITFSRYSYLKKITQLRQQQKYVFYYISERIIDANYNFNNPWQHNSQETDICKNQCVLFHAISKKGLTNALFNYSATEDDFYKWVRDILLDCLHQGNSRASVLVLDNSPLHGRPKSKSITMFDTKSDMKQWLRNHNVPFSDAMKKSQLYQLVKKHADIEEIPRVDQLIKAHGHHVLRLPTHFEDLSPIEHIWKDIKSNFTEPRDNLHDDTLLIFANIPLESYVLYENDIIERENALFHLDSQMDNFLDIFLTDLKDNSSNPVDTLIID
ncbi:hypothetical protein PYW08_015915 [Mythimna loreyi]|uniref:Uncharacterized protein n=1 Tax=Mythimna loreyi TaxID=667449 RepID=A0ACC2QT57_9NEOP|nr:hypothetical protein PYW08_015915 [Mythimna loreyi]